MPIQITIIPYLIYYEYKINTVKSLHHLKRSLFFLICSFHSYIIKDAKPMQSAHQETIH